MLSTAFAPPHGTGVRASKIPQARCACSTVTMKPQGCPNAKPAAGCRGAGEKVPVSRKRAGLGAPENHRKGLVGMKRNKRIAIGCLAALALGLSALTGSGPAARPQDRLAPPPAIVMVQPAAAQATATEEPDTRKSTVWGRLRRFFLRPPRWVRLAVLAPLWAVGWVLSQLLAAALPLAAKPLLGVGCRLLFYAASLLLLCLTGWRLAFPNRPLREFFTRKNIRSILLGALVLLAVDVLAAWLPGQDEKDLTGLWLALRGTTAAVVLGRALGLFCRKPHTRAGAGTAAPMGHRTIPG